MIAQKLWSHIVIPVPTIPITPEIMRAYLLPNLISEPLKAADIINVTVEHDPMILSFTVAVLPVHPNLASRHGVI